MKRHRIHVLCNGRSVLAQALAARAATQLLPCPHHVLPVPSQVVRGEVIVCDLDDAPSSMTPQSLKPLAERGLVLLLSGERPVLSGWFELVADGRVQHRHAGTAERAAGFPETIARILQLSRVADPRVTAHLVLAANSRWLDLESAVRSICNAPWAVRRPSDLAEACDCSLIAIKRACAEVGYARVEHFITDARNAIRDCLKQSIGLSVRNCNLLAGIGDSSNFRRQLGRAKNGVGPGALLLALAAGLTSCAPNDDAQAVPPDSARETGAAIALPVTGAVVERGDLVITLRTTGRVRAERLVSVRSETQGTVAEVAVRPGEQVTRGAVLARLDTRPFDLAVRDAEAGLVGSPGTELEFAL